MTKPEITIDPLPPTQGQAARVSYTGNLPVTLNIEWTPKGVGVATITIGRDGWAELRIPGDAEAVKITDPNGEADAEASAVLPS